MPVNYSGTWNMISNVNFDGYMVAIGEELRSNSNGFSFIKSRTTQRLLKIIKMLRHPWLNWHCSIAEEPLYSVCPRPKVRISHCCIHTGASWCYTDSFTTKLS
uniref:Cytosolic fatty-acid binding proteins domain-containing protein n=1 Tax=Anguilla anguilla TaxID=7936 RepID=A0A0E9TRD7_ANGAN